MFAKYTSLLTVAIAVAAFAQTPVHPPAQARRARENIFRGHDQFQLLAHHGTVGAI